MSQSNAQIADLRERYRTVRKFTETLASPLGAEDQTIQSMPDASPTKWQRAHVTWFFETFILSAFQNDYQSHHPMYNYLFNSYYEAIGDRHPRSNRGLLSRPTIEEISEYRQAIDQSMESFFHTLRDSADTTLLNLIELGLHHEQQHQELILMDIKHALSLNPLAPAYLSTSTSEITNQTHSETALNWVHYPREITRIGHGAESFSFDNEGPNHEVLIQSFNIADRLITCGEWLSFIENGGYQKPELWLSEGWQTVMSAGWDSPAYWSQTADKDWQIFTLSGQTKLIPEMPVAHISYYEADAFARWYGARLPLETEWEHAARNLKVRGNFSDDSFLNPLPAQDDSLKLKQIFGDLWEWTASPYVAYPGFSAASGAVGEYNGKFMVNQMVLRGGSCATPRDHMRLTYRNFFPPHSRWMFSGLRLAKDET